MIGIEYFLATLLADLHIVAAITAAVYLLAFVCAVREIMNSRTSQGSIAWLLSLGMLPFPTAFLYLIFGWKFFDGYATDRIRNGRSARPLRAKDLALID
ncbi:MAG TPA: PLDc N-terminal domain-containing protein, partial [Devosia sp.]|nr:PLDc N-terminal domain-containing protein [Devosia sp.]